MKRRERAPDLCPVCGASWSCEHSQRKPEKPSALVKELTALADQADLKAAQDAKYVTWRDHANEVLRHVFNDGCHEPTRKEIYDAYPFGMRKYFPYKVWCEQVRWWKAGRPDKKPKPFTPPKEQAVLL